MQPSFDEVEFRLVNIQHQSNGSDCGLFAIACATELAHDRDPPLLCVWETERMRPHLRDCFESRKIPCGYQNDIQYITDSKVAAFVGCLMILM